MASDGKVVISTALDNSGLKKGVNNVSGSLGGLKSVVKSVGTTIAAAFSIAKVVQFGASASQTAMQLSDALTGLQSIVEGQGRSFSRAKSFLDDYVEDGLIPMQNAAAAYKNLAARGYDDSQIEQTLVALKNASAYGRQASLSMGEAVQSASEGLKNENSILVDNAGVTKNVSKMWEEYAASIGTTAAKLTQEQKIQAEVNGILKESKYQAGDAAKVAGTLSGQLNRLSFNFNQLKVAIGNIINPIVKRLLPVINNVLSAVTTLANKIATIVSGIFGKVETQTKATSTAAKSAADAENKLAAGIDKASKAAKKSIAGFDELTTLQEAVSSSDSVSMSNVANEKVTVESRVEDTLTPQMQEIVDSINRFIGDLKTKFAEGDWYGAGKTLGETLAAGMESVDWKKVGSVIGKILGEVISFILGLALNIDPMTIQNAATRVVTGLLASLTTTIQQMDWSDVGRKIVDLVVFAIAMSDPAGQILYLMLTPEGTDLVNTASKLIGSIIGALLSAVIGAGQRSGEIAQELWNAIKTYFDDYVNWEGTPAEIINGLWDGIKAALANVGTWVRDNIWIPFRDGFMEAFNIPKTGGSSGETEKFGSNIIEGLCSGISQKIAKVKKACTDIREAIQEKFAGIGSWFKEKFSDAWAKVKDVFSGDSKIFSGIKEGISSAFKNIVNYLIDGINKIIKKPFDKINGMLNTIRSFSIAGVKPFEGLWSINPLSVPQIPKLAQGAVLPANKPFLAMVGDQRHGTNVEAPLSTIQEAVALVMQDQTAAILAGFESSVGVQREILEAVLGIQIGDDVIGNAVARYNYKQAVIRGGAV